MMSSTDSKSIGQYVDELRTLGPAKFASVYTDPMLLLRDLGEEDEEDPAFHTAFMSRDAMAEALASPGAQEAPKRSLQIGAVVRIHKREGGVFADRIGVGRARNADVPLALARISKYHAYFSRDAAGGWSVTDAGSTNGTFVDGVRVQERLPARISNGQEVAFGPYRFAFYLAEGFLEIVKRRVALR